MRRSSVIFLAIILVPSLVLAALAVRSARDQQIILEHQQAIISQDITDALAKRVQTQLDGSTSEFVQTTQRLLTQSQSPRELANNFNQQLRTSWKLADVGFAVDVSGAIYSPLPSQGTRATTFLNETGRFLSNRENVPVFSKRRTKVLLNLRSWHRKTLANLRRSRSARTIRCCRMLRMRKPCRSSGRYRH